MSKLSIGLILPDVLGTYGDNGNALIVQQRARMRGIDAEIVSIHLGEKIPESLDIYCLGGGEDTAQILAAEHINNDRGLHRAVDSGAQVLAVCAGFQVLGEKFRAADKEIIGAALIDASTTALPQRAIGEIRSTATIPGVDEPLTGFENHMGKTVLGPDARPLATIKRGVGNDGTVEGAIQGSVIATYMHGPVLARNPRLADLLLSKAVGFDLEPLDIPVVERLRKERLSV
ncbi:glutamine amidotransferase [Corynebacterium sp. ES2794-CONJ1]|uniref:type 1 glutamine amidotransferase n=1 Tax=unclassified Corynebacterium TaxID=2624378 RepID=UPI0021671F66|nr:MULTISPECIES: glutamine amidotransferase [unclassified Corynebacterium]MCS4490350.1 glutamine amidotransferase [Corynebacterium sp. ES2775-CONJ]MCS4492128.1 glutamine amidotransferase [Corynebacterium sp. ES2715-CONJ3]MCS4532388.1 glutamine amidotransferase [Corynebacterium sp. ES2730-CONJ]MCU9519649.1 glutamine amidotransferase [Corynebacterium sp. ES2794-CONJ1]